jgi:hypothetical protein
MPKPFMLGVEVEEIALGKVMRALNNMPGIVKLHMNLHPKAEKSSHAGKPRNAFNQTGPDLVVEALAKEPMATAKVRQLFIDAGRSYHSINSVLHNLRKAGLIDNADGVWKLTKKMKDRLRHKRNDA